MEIRQIPQIRFVLQFDFEYSMFEWRKQYLTTTMSVTVEAVIYAKNDVLLQDT